ncbi:hypothetical protein P3L10_002038 [Capsicum annuum]
METVVGCRKSVGDLDRREALCKPALRCYYCQVMRLVDSFRLWMQGDHVMIVILMIVVDFIANCLGYSIMMM